MSDEQAGDVLDDERVADLQQLGRERFIRLVGTFTASAWEQVDEIEQAVMAGDPDALRRAAHSLKGASRVYGAFRVAALAEALEAGVQAAEPAVNRHRTERLRHELAAAAAALEALAGGPGPDG